MQLEVKVCIKVVHSWQPLLNGCPCPDYQCPATISPSFSTTTSSSITTTSAALDTWILVLTYQKAPMIIDGKGQSKEIGLNFESKNQNIGSCSIVWNGTMFLFGANTNLNKRDILVVDECELTKKGELPFDMAHGAPVRHPHLFLGFRIRPRYHSKAYGLGYLLITSLVETSQFGQVT